MRNGLGIFLLLITFCSLAVAEKADRPPNGIREHAAFVAASALVEKWEPLSPDETPGVLAPLFVGTPEEERVRIWMSPQVWDPTPHRIFQLRESSSLIRFGFDWAMATDQAVWDFWGILLDTDGPYPIDSLARRTQVELQSGGFKSGLIAAPGRQPVALYELSDCQYELRYRGETRASAALEASFQSPYSTLTLFIAPAGRSPAAVAILSK